MAFFAAQGGDDFLFLEGLQERFLCRVTGPFPGKTFDAVVGDQIDFCVQPFCQRGQRFDLIQPIVHFRDEDVFEGDLAPVFLR